MNPHAAPHSRRQAFEWGRANTKRPGSSRIEGFPHAPRGPFDSAARGEEEADLLAQGYRIIAGVDEAGRGCLAGPVVAAAVILEPGSVIHGIDDSKRLGALRREQLDRVIRLEALSIGLGVVQEETIDAVNILQATLLAMRRAISALDPPPDFVLIDGDRSPGCSNPHRAIPSGDQRCYSIAAASIIAKVTRDRMMRAYHLAYPEYGFAQHKGYGTRDHLLAIARYGASPFHRKSFKGVRDQRESLLQL